MINFGINIASLLGILLALIGILIIPLGLSLRRPFRVGNVIQDIVFAVIYLLCGLIFFSQGWRLDPVLQFWQLLLTISSIYLLIKDILRHSSLSRD